MGKRTLTTLCEPALSAFLASSFLVLSLLDCQDKRFDACCQPWQRLQLC